VLGDGTTNGTISNSASITNDGTLVFNRTTGSSFNYGNPIAGMGDLVKDGAGTQTLSGANTYSGFTTINAGTLQVGNGGSTGSLGTATVTNNGSLLFDRSNAVVQGTDFGAIEGTGSVIQSGTDLLTLSFANAYSGGTTVNAGTLVVAAPGAIGTGGIVANGGTIRYIGVANGANVNPLVVNGATVLDVNTNWNFNGNITGSGDITRGTLATQSLWLGGDNSGYTGTFTIPANGNAVVRFTNPTAGSAAAKWVVNQNVASRVSLSFANGTIQLGSLTGTGFLTSEGAGNTIEVGQLGLTETFAGVIQGNAANAVNVTKVGAGTLTLTGAHTYSGATTISAGALQLGDGTLDGTIAATSGMTNHASLIYNWANAHTAGYAISGSGTLTKNGAGALTLGGTNTYTGDTILNAGSIAVDGDSIADTGKVAINGGTIALTGTEIVGSLDFGGVPQATGTWGATGSGAAHIDDTRFTGTGLLQVGGAGSAYTTWASTKGLTAGVNDGAEQDAEFDGIANALEFVFGGDPLASDTGKLPVLTTDANNFIFTFNRADESEAEIALTFQYGSTLNGWTDVAIGADNAGSGSGVNITENAALADTVVVTVPKTSAVGGKLFGRLRAVK
jgi:fibronectin-binding autotransporter adhesin